MFILTAPDGLTEHFVDATVKEQKVRFGVGTNSGQRSAVWNVIVNPKGDIYIGERSTMSMVKISLHESGVRRLAYVEKYAAAKLPADLDRKIADWLPVELAPGWLHELDIWVPEDQVNTVAKVDGKPRSLRQIIWLPAPPKGSAAVFRFITCQPLHPNYQRISYESRKPTQVAGFWLNRTESPELLVILATEIALMHQQTQYLQVLGKDSAAHPASLRKKLHADGRRAVMFDVEADPPRIIDQSII